MHGASHHSGRRCLFVLAGLLAFASLAGAARAQAAPAPLFVTGQLRLDADYHGQIVVAVAGSTLDCDGHAVIGTGEGVGINVVASAVTVRECRVSGFATGIQTSGDATGIVDNDTSGNGEGIRLAGATDTRVSGNRATHNDLWGIILAQASTTNRVDENDASDNGILGVALNQAPRNLIERNVANRNGNSGFDIAFASDANRIRDNVASNNHNAGFQFALSRDDVVSGNTANDNGAAGNGCGFCFSDASGDIVTRNVALRSGGVGFFLFFASERNLLTRNRACDSFFVDAADHGDGVGNTWRDNDFCSVEGGLQ
jgi:parallel beta-helix repeat protein